MEEITCCTCHLRVRESTERVQETQFTLIGLSLVVLKMFTKAIGLKYMRHSKDRLEDMFMYCLERYTFLKDFNHHILSSLLKLIMTNYNKHFDVVLIYGQRLYLHC